MIGASFDSLGLFVADELTAAVAATGLVGCGRPLPQLPLDTPDWERLLLQVRFHRISGLLAAAIDASALPATDVQLEEAATTHAADITLCLRLEADLLAAASVLDDAGIGNCVLKGSSFAHLDYPDPALRVFADVDLLVPSCQYDDALNALLSAGYRRSFDEVRPGFDRRFGKGVSLSFPGRRRQIDLHRTLVMGPFGLAIPLDDLWSRMMPFVVGDHTLQALDAECRFLHACYHAAIGNARARLGPLRDLVGMLQRREPPSSERVLALAASWRGEAVVARAVTLAWKAFLLEPTPLSSWAQAYEPDRSEQRALRSYLDLDLGYAARSFAALRAIPRWRDKVAFASALAMPSQAYGAGRHRHRWARWRVAAREIAQLQRRGRR